MIRAIHVGSFGCGGLAFYLRTRIRRDDVTDDRLYCRVTIQNLIYADGRPATSDDRGEILRCATCGDVVDVTRGDIRQEQDK